MQVVFLIALLESPSTSGPFFGQVRARPVAIVLETTGKPTLLVTMKSEPLRSLKLLRPGDEVKAGAGDGVLILFVADGHMEKLSPASSILVQEKGGKATGIVEWVPSRLDARNLDALRKRVNAEKLGGTIARSGDAPKPAIAPINGAVVATDRPTLRWPAVKDAASYRVELLVDTGGADAELVWRRPSSEPILEYPADAKPLARTIVYRWRVTAVQPNKSEKTAIADVHFVVGTEAMETQAAELRKLAAGKQPADLVLAAAGFESLGMTDELYPLYKRLTQIVTADPCLWAMLGDSALKAGLKDESEKAWNEAYRLGWPKR
jgi:hypothetical protein